MVEVVQRDWENREFIETIQQSILQIVTFLNQFDISTRYRLTQVQAKLTRLERHLDYLEASISQSDPRVREAEKPKVVAPAPTPRQEPEPDADAEAMHNGDADTDEGSGPPPIPTAVVKAPPSPAIPAAAVRATPPPAPMPGAAMGGPPPAVPGNAPPPVPVAAVAGTPPPAPKPAVPRSAPPPVPGAAPGGYMPNGSQPPPHINGGPPPGGPMPPVPHMNGGGPVPVPAGPVPVPAGPAPSVPVPGQQPPQPPSQSNYNDARGGAGVPGMGRPPPQALGVPPTPHQQGQLGGAPPGSYAQPPDMYDHRAPSPAIGAAGEMDSMDSAPVTPRSSSHGTKKKRKNSKKHRHRKLKLGPNKDISLKVLKEGDNKTFPHGASVVLVDYTGYLQDGSKFDTSVDYTIALGTRTVVEGLEIVLQEMSLGSRASFKIPSYLAYGSSGAPGVIPPDCDLKFDLELKDIQS